MMEDSVVIRLRWILAVDHKKCLYKSFLGLSSMKYQRSALLAPCEDNPPVVGGFPSQRASNICNAQSISMS